MDAVFLKLLNMSLTASWLCLAVLILRLLLKRAPKAISCALWALVGMRLLFPFSLESVLSLIPSAEPLPEDMLLSPTPTINSGIPAINSVVNPVISDSLAPTPGASVNPMQVITTVAGYVWVIGMIAMLVYMLISYLRVKSKVAEAAKIEGNVYECDHIDTPFILGVFRPRIYLPSSMNEADRAFVIAHEQAHLRRLDHLWKPLGFVLLTVYWFNPLLWLGYILLCRDIELACDEKVIRALGTDIKKQYSEALINCSVPRRAISACPLAFGEVGVKGRIKSVLNYKKPAFWIILVAVVALVVTGVCFLTDPRENNGNAQAALLNISNRDMYYIDLVYCSQLATWISPDDPSFTPNIHISGDTLYAISGNGSDLMEIGSLSPINLTLWNFDRCFTGINVHGTGVTAIELRKNNAHAWIVNDTPWSKEDTSVVSYLLLQKNGDIYLTRGNASQVKNIHSVFKYKISEQISIREVNYTVWDFIKYPENTFYSTDHNSVLRGAKFIYNGAIYMIDRAGKETELISGMPVQQAVFADLNEDGYPEFLGQANMGSGFIHEFIVVYDIKNEQFYHLNERFTFDFGLATDTGSLSVRITDVISPAPGSTFAAIPLLVKNGDGYVLELRNGSDVLYRSFADGTHESMLPTVTGSYAFSPDNSWYNQSTVTLYGNNQFSFVFSPVSSYLGYGKYEIKDGRLILSTDDGKYTYVFEMHKDKLIYRETESNGYNGLGQIADGSEFIKQNTN